MEEKMEGKSKKCLPADQRGKKLLRKDPDKHLLTFGEMYQEGTIVPSKRIPSLIRVFEWAIRHTLFRKACEAGEKAIAALKEQLAEAEKERGEPPFRAGDHLGERKLPVDSLDGENDITNTAIFVAREIFYSEQHGQWVVKVRKFGKTEDVEGIYPADAFKKLPD